ncbi:MAG: hypothetical protein JWM20_599 [Patescibacteria group bacterium]|nr:hypothetical protein [Patescibacteria group bacterium]
MNTLISLLCNSDFPTLAHGVGIACLTILIPVAIVVLGEKEFQGLDNLVVLDHITEARNILLYSGLIFVPVIFWNHSTITLRIIELGAWMIGLYLLIRILTKSYYWMKGNKFPLRFNYLKNLSEPKDMETAWKSVWENKEMNVVNEAEFFKIFKSKIDDGLK